MYPTVFIRAREVTQTTEPGGMAHHGHHGHGHHGHGHHGHHAGPVVHHHTAVTATGPMVHHNTAVTVSAPGILPQQPAKIRCGKALGVGGIFFLIMCTVAFVTGFIGDSTVWMSGLVFVFIGVMMLILGVCLYRKGRFQQQQQQQGTVYPPGGQPGGQPIVYPPPTGVPVGQPGGQPMAYPPPTGVPVGQPGGQPMAYPPPTGVPVGQPGGQPTYNPSEEVAYHTQTQPSDQPYSQHYTPMVPYASQTHADDTSPVIPTVPPPSYDNVLGSTQKDESRL